MPNLSESLTHSFVIRAAALAAVLIFAFWPLLGDRLFHPIERVGTALARKKWLAIFAVAVIPILIRVVLLIVVAPPLPSIHDEFSYLLASDTLARGKLTNPSHPMWQFFDTFHVIQQPTYMSKYPPAQGFFLAFGQLLGHPWIGVLLSMGLAYGSALWMMQGWLPPQWAFIGVVLLMARFDLLSYWANSYWGGFVALIGGALVMGALPRLMRRCKVRYAVVMAVGVGILANSRPYEGFLLCVPVVIALIIWLFSAKSPPWRVTASKFIAPAGVLCVLIFIFMGYYNFRLTGHVSLFPYMAYANTHDPIPIFVWEKFGTIHYENPQFAKFYGEVEPAVIAGRMWNGHWQKIVQDVFDTASHMFFSGRITVVVLLAGFLWIIRDRRTRLLLIQATICFAGFCLSTWLISHYTAPVVATIFCLVVQVMRHLRRMWIGDRPVGIGLTRLMVLGVIGASCFSLAMRIHNATNKYNTVGLWRETVVEQLDQQAGEQLALVRYTPEHNVHDEWVYNRADIDHSKIVWAREIPGLDLAPLLKYFPDRQVWVVEPDVTPPKVTRYR